MPPMPLAKPWSPDLLPLPGLCWGALGHVCPSHDMGTLAPSVCVYVCLPCSMRTSPTACALLHSLMVCVPQPKGLHPQQEESFGRGILAARCLTWGPCKGGDRHSCLNCCWVSTGGIRGGGSGNPRSAPFVASSPGPAAAAAASIASGGAFPEAPASPGVAPGAEAASGEAFMLSAAGEGGEDPSSSGGGSTCRARKGWRGLLT